MASFDTKRILDIAVVASATNIHPNSSTFSAISKVIDSDNRYHGSKVSLVAWDAPNDWFKYTHIILSTGIAYAVKYDEFLDWLNSLSETVCKRVFNPPSVIKWNMNKTYLKDYKNKGIRIPPTVIIQAGESLSFEEVISSLEELSEPDQLQSIVVKHLVDAGGYSADRIVLKEDGAKERFNTALAAAKRGLIVQKYLTTVKAIGEWSLVYIDRKLSHAVIKKPDVEGFKVQTRFGGKVATVANNLIPKHIRDFGDDVIEATQVENLLYARVDILQDIYGLPCLMELELFEPNLYLSTNQLAETFLNAISRY